MSQVQHRCAQIRKINPRLSEKECLIIHNYMNDMSYVMQRMNTRKFTLLMFRGMMEEYFTQYSYIASTIMEFKAPHKKIDAVLIAIDGIEFNVFFENEIKVLVFREDNPYKHIFEISISEEDL